MGKEIKLVGELGLTHVALVRFPPQVHLLVNFHAGKMGELLLAKATSEEFFKWRIFLLVLLLSLFSFSRVGFLVVS